MTRCTRVWSILLLAFSLLPTLHAQTTAVQPPVAVHSPAVSAGELNYPDSSSGLERMVKDIMKAQQENDGARADVLLKSLVLPNAGLWYAQVFEGGVAEATESTYERASASIPPSVARFLMDAQSENMNEVRAVRFDRTCDDNAGEDTFGILHARVQPVPLYELRLIRGDKFVRLFAFAFVNGGFRFIITPKMEGGVFGRRQPKNSAADKAGTTAEDNDADPRVRMGAAIQAAMLVHRIQPQYPQIARQEHLQGRVKMHALIAKDGSIRKLYVIKGYCSLAESSVEVDTEIDVIFSLP